MPERGARRAGSSRPQATHPRLFQVKRLAHDLYPRAARALARNSMRGGADGFPAVVYDRFHSIAASGGLRRGGV